MSETSLDDVFGGGAGSDGGGAPPPPPPEQRAPEQQAAPEPGQQEAAEPGAERAEGEPEQRPEGEESIPRRAFEEERRKRQDWKDRAARAEAERDALRRQLEEARQATAAAPPAEAAAPAAPAWVDPSQDPAGFIDRVQQVLINERLNASEMMLKREIGEERVAALVEEFKGEVARDPSLRAKLYQQADPYGWLAREMEAIRLRREIGEDPNGYRAKLEQEIRAKLEAEFAGAGAGGAAAPAAPGGAPLPRMAPSLANARSAAPRSAPVHSGPTALEDVLRR